MRELPHLMGIYTVVRTMMVLRSLEDVFRGGVGSYTLVMMIIASLKLAPGSSMGQSLINFFGFYGNLDTYKETIGLMPPALHPKLDHANQVAKLGPDATAEEKWIAAKQLLGTAATDKRFLLVLQDPANLTNDLGRKAFAWKHIQATFKAAHETLQESIKSPSPHKSLLTPLIGGCHEAFAERRAKMEEYGQMLLDRSTEYIAVESQNSEQTKENRILDVDEMENILYGGDQNKGVEKDIEQLRSKIDKLYMV